MKLTNRDFSKRENLGFLKKKAGAHSRIFQRSQNLTKYVSLVSIALGLHVQSLSFNDVRRLISIEENDEEDVAKIKEGETDYLAQVLIDQIPTFCDGELIRYTSGLATLFKGDKEHRELLPRVYLCWDLRDSCQLVGACNTLRFVSDSAIGTELLTHVYLAKHSLPQFDHNWTLIDIVCSRRSPTMTLLVMNIFGNVSRGRARNCVGLLAVAINEKSRKSLHKLGFMEHKFKHGYLMYCRLEAIRLDRVMARLNFAENELMLKAVCFRHGLTKNTEDKLISRC
jgi:hypothetical protein